MFAAVVDMGVCMNDLDRRRRVETLFSEHSAAVRAYARRRVPAATAAPPVATAAPPAAARPAAMM